jgi:hypothetical protein
VSSIIAPRETGGAVVTGVQVWQLAIATEPTTARQARARTTTTEESFIVTVSFSSLWFGREGNQFPQGTDTRERLGIRKEKKLPESVGNR